MRFTRILAALAAVSLGLAATAAPAAAPEATVESGRLSGTAADGVLAFKGIPYAAAPTGERRWRPPAAPASWSGVRPADHFGATCPQPQRPDGGAAAGAGQPQSEDCLFLNVWSFAGAHKAPVMVWIHGGAFRLGAGSSAIYDGTAFARDGVILVSLNYRLGALGFFAHPALTRAAAPDEPLANYGLMDQMAALRWVKRNIAAFGGDPDNVTVFGESAGGESVESLLAIPSAKGLFARAIIESGGGWSRGKSLATAEQQGVDLARTAGGLGPDATLAQLRAIPADKLFAIPLSLGAVGPVVDGRLLPRSVTQTFAAGGQIQAPLMIGSNSYEASLMKSFHLPTEAMLKLLPPALRTLYPGDDDTATSDFFTDVVMGAPARWIAGRAAAGGSPAWLYRFDYVPTARRGQTPGTQHGGEIPFVFATWSSVAGPVASPEDRRMEALAHGCWVAFAKLGRPDCGAAPWPAYDPGKDTLMGFGVTTAPASGVRKAQDDVLERVALPRLMGGGS